MKPIVPGHQVTWTQFKQAVPMELGRMYRGEPSSNWQLESTLRRALPASDDLLLVEGDLLFRYRQAVGNFIAPGQIPSGHIDWLASMQHLGAPTRLLDFTASPYVAAYFAMEQEAEGDAVIWSFDKWWFQSRCEDILAGYDRPLKGLGHPHLVNWLYEKELLPARRLVAPAGCFRLSQRQLAQQAVFMVTGDLSVSFEENIRAMGTEEELSQAIVRYELKRSYRAEVLEDLRLMNVSRMTLFPSLDGFAQSLRYTLVEDPVEQRNIRAVLLRLASGIDRKSAVSEGALVAVNGDLEAGGETLTPPLEGSV
jgi:hypothetical protein